MNNTVEVRKLKALFACTLLSRIVMPETGDPPMASIMIVVAKVPSNEVKQVISAAFVKEATTYTVDSPKSIDKYNTYYLNAEKNRIISTLTS